MFYPVLDFSTDPTWHDIFYNEPTPERVHDLHKFLLKLKHKPEIWIRLYHGTWAEHPVTTKGLLPTSPGRSKSLGVTPGYVYLSVYPGSAINFGRMAYPGKPVALYAVDIPTKRLRPDLDQLYYRRLNSDKYSDIGDTLAESLVYGHGGRVKGKISPNQITLWEVS